MDRHEANRDSLSQRHLEPGSNIHTGSQPVSLATRPPLRLPPSLPMYANSLLVGSLVLGPPDPLLSSESEFFCRSKGSP